MNPTLREPVNRTPTKFTFTLLVSLSFALTASAADPQAGQPDLSKITSRTDIEAIIAATADGALKKALTDHTDAVLAAAKQHPHVEAVIRAIESSPGSFEKVNTTPKELQEATGGKLAVFDTLTQVRTSISGGGAHDHRKKHEDPYDATFIEHLGHIESLETVYLEATRIEDAWVTPLLKLRNLKKLTIIGFGQLGDASLNHLQHLNTACPNLTDLELAYFGKATDAGLELLAGLKDLERFAFRGSPVRGHGFAKFEGWDKLRSINFHSNNLDDEGLGYVCERFPNLEFIKLWHSHVFTDASAEHFKQLSKLKGIEIGCHEATAGLLKYFHHLPLEYVALSYGVNAPAADAIASVRSISTLRRFSIDCESFTEDDLKLLAGLSQLEELSLGRLPLTDKRIAQLQDFNHLKQLELAERRKDFRYSEDLKAKVKAALPGVEVKFVQ